MNDTENVAYCRLCAKLKQYDILTYLQTGEEMWQKVVNNLSRFNIIIDFQQSILPKTVCLPCVRSLEQAFSFVTEVEQAQAFLSDFIRVQINAAESDSCDENILCEPPNEPIHVVDSSDEISRDFIEVNDDGIHLNGVCDGEVMSDDSDDVYYDYSVINRNTEAVGIEKKHDKQPTNDIIEIKDESDEEVTNKLLAKEQNNNSALRPFNITVCSVDKINTENIRQASIQNMDKLVQKLQLRHKESNSQLYPPKELATTANSESHINIIQKTSNNKQKNCMMVNKNIISDEETIKLSWKDYKWKCTFCQIIFPHIEELQKHSMQAHNFCNPYQCTDCTSVRIKLNMFLSHIRSHRSDLQYSCYKCFKRFLTLSYTRAHIKTVHEHSKYVCFGCNTPFNSIKELKEHSNKYYNKRYPNIVRRVCEICGKSFFYLNQLRYHMEIDHNVENNSLHCDTCNSSFPNRRQLQLHKDTHTEFKPFSCDTCGNTFRMKRNLVRHMLTHTDTRASCCTVCSKKFRLPAHLKLHMRLHTGEKPYSCDVCQNRFRNICNRNEHVRRCHGIELSHRRQPNKIQQTVPDETSPDTGGCSKKVDEK